MKRARKLRKQTNQKGYAVYSLSVPAEIGDTFNIEKDKFFCELSQEGEIVFSTKPHKKTPAPPTPPLEPEPEAPDTEPEEDADDDMWDFAPKEVTPESVFEKDEEKKPDNSMFEGW